MAERTLSPKERNRITRKLDLLFAQEFDGIFPGTTAEAIVWEHLEQIDLDGDL